jgi:hypothetical protein
MPFIWTNQPQLPSPPQIETPGPLEVSTLVDKVANTANAGDTLLYYTPNTQYNVVHVIPQMNVRTTRLTNANVGHLTVNASINIEHTYINTAVFGSVTANVLYLEVGTMGRAPNSNNEIATKEYLDSLVSNITPGGSDLQNLIDAAGDLLVGVSPNTAVRLPVGNSGQVLSVDFSETSGLRWKTIGSTGSEVFSGLWLQTHQKRYLQNTQIWLRHCADVVYTDGSHGRGLSNLVCDITVSGVGGLDTGVERNSQWYEIYMIRDTANSANALLLHQSTNIVNEASLTTVTDFSRILRGATDPNDLLGQSFVSANGGLIHSVELEFSSVGSPNGLLWVEIRDDSGQGGGFPGNTIVTSRVFDTTRILSENSRIRFIFDTDAALLANISYHIVLTADYTRSDSNYIQLRGLAAGGYPSGKAIEHHFNDGVWFNCSDVSGPGDFYFKVFIQNIPATNIVLPSSYDVYCLLGYVYNNSAGNFKHFIQRDRHLLAFISQDWRGYTTATGAIEAADLSTVLPPRDGMALVEVMYRSPAALHIPIGGIDCTDMPVTLITKNGYTTANTHGLFGPASGGAGLYKYAPIIIENQTMLVRSNVPNCNVYVTDFAF